MPSSIGDLKKVIKCRRCLENKKVKVYDESGVCDPCREILGQQHAEAYHERMERQS